MELEPILLDQLTSEGDTLIEKLDARWIRRHSPSYRRHPIMKGIRNQSLVRGNSELGRTSC